ncbi:alpha/beta hydrolase, partial [Achromobacter insolitus]|uniref:alpha/beta fold hydrolase n=2 Tax=Achromobacter TaxID=222 RepID=UPI002FDF0105
MQRRDTDIAVNGMSLRLTEWGPGEGRPLFMLHGIRGYAETFAGVAQALQPDFRVLAYDQRGRGASSWDPGRNYYTDAYVDDLAGVADALRVDSFDLLGHSMGGIAAIVFAARYPARVRRLIVEDAGPAAFEGSAGAARIQRELRETPQSFTDLTAARAYLRALRPSVTEAAREERLRHMLKEDGAGGWTWRHDHAG